MKPLRLGMDHDDLAIEEDEGLLTQQQLAHKKIHWFRRPTVWSVTILLFLMTFASTTGVLLQQVVMLQRACNLIGSPGECDQKQAQVVVLNLEMWLTTVTGGLGLITASKVGPLLDRYGRRPLLVAIISTYAIFQTIYYYGLRHFYALNAPILILATVIGALAGGVVGLGALINCYISDVVKTEDRIHSLGYISAGAFIAGLVGPLAGNWAVGWASRGGPVDLVDTLGGINPAAFAPMKLQLLILYVAVAFVVALPELRSKANRERSRSSLSLGSIRLPNSEIEGGEAPVPWYRKWLSHLNLLQPLRIIWIPRGFRDPATLNRDRTVVLWVVVCEIGSVVIANCSIAVMLLYGMYQFKWTVLDIGHLLAAICVARAVMLMFVLPFIAKTVFPNWLGLHANRLAYDNIDFILIFSGLIVETCSFIGLHYAQSTAQFFTVLVCGAMGAMATPAMNLVVIKFYPSSKTGEVFGALSVIKSLASIAMPLLFLAIYKYTLAEWDQPGFVFLVFGSCTAFFAVSQVVIRRLMHA